jgi:predicted  nucleic acid-binding Zn-ribbon protein
MKASHDHLLKLLEVQELDTGIERIKHQASTLEVHQQIADLLEKRSRMGDELIAAKTVHLDLIAAAEKAEEDVVPVRERLVRYEAKVEAADMDPKALQSAIEEVAHLKTRISDLEDLELEAMESMEQAGKAVEDLEQGAKDIERDLHTLVNTRDQQVGELAHQAQELSETRRQVSSTIAEDVVGLYTKIASRCQGVGVARLEGRRCSGCGLEATVADYNSYLAADIDQVLRCAECDRILVRTAPQ